MAVLRTLARWRTEVGTWLAADWSSCDINVRESFLRALLEVTGKRKDSWIVQRYGNQWGIGSERFPAPTQVQMGEGLLRRCRDSWEGGKRSRSLQYLPFFFRGHTMDVCPCLSQVAHVLPGQKSKVWPLLSHPGHTVFSNTGQVGLRSSPHKWPGWPQYAQNCS